MSCHVRYGLLLILLTAGTFAHVVGNNFIDLDDSVYITQNPHVMTGLTSENIAWAFTTNHANFWHPLTWLSLQLDATWFGTESAWGFHLVNLLLHLANVLLLYRVLAFITDRATLSCWVAALFAVHPLHVESVAWATERKDVLSTFFWLLGIAAYVWYARKPDGKRMALVTLALTLGLMSKPILVTFPFTLLLLDFWPLRRWPQGLSPSRFAAASPGRLLAEKLPLFFIVTAASIVTFVIKKRLEEVQDLALTIRAINAVTSYGWYLWKTFLPLRLGVYYSHPKEDWEAIPTIASGLILTGITLGAVLSARTRPYLLVGWLWFLGTLVPNIGLVQVGDQARADRFVYVPHIGLFVALMWLLADLVERLRISPYMARTLGIALMLILAVLSWLQVSRWKNAVTLWEHTRKVTDNDPFAVWNLAKFLTAMGDPRSLDQALSLLNEGLRKKDHGELHFWKGVVLGLKGNSPEAIRHYRKALELKSHHWNARQSLAYLLLNQGEIDEAIEHFSRLLNKPEFAPVSHLYLGVAWTRKGEEERAIYHFREALQGEKERAPAHRHLGLALMKRGEFQSAEQHFREGVALEKKSPSSEFYLGLALTRQKKWRQAMEPLARAAPHHPRYHSALAYARYESGDKEAARMEYGNLSQRHPPWLTEFAAAAFQLATDADATQRDPQEAFEMAAQTCQATNFRDPNLLDTLAVTQAAKGDFKAAEQTATDALKLVDNQTDLTQRLRQRLHLYESRQPVLQQK